jgi:circadian clock protein KaiC
MISSAEQAATGVFGLDDVLQGGLSRGHVFLVEGEPGAGKTTIALQFLLEGAKAGENSLYITLSETEANSVVAQYLMAGPSAPKSACSN